MGPRESSRARDRARTLLVIVACVVLDQATKAAARALLMPGRRYSWLHDLFRLELVHNRGAFLSLGAGLPDSARSAVFTWGVLLLVAGAMWVALVRAGSPTVALGAALVAGGGLGNLWDRILANGMVTDFMNLGLGSLRTGVFNVADLAIVGGAVLLLFPARTRPPEPPDQTAPT
jgi:signal peptidase II